MNQQIPTFTVHVDTLSEEYQIFGQDSIQLKNKSIYSLDKTAGAFYIKNGYMNIVPTFEYDLYKPVFFLLYYDGEKDIDTSNNKLNLNLYFNNMYLANLHTSFLCNLIYPTFSRILLYSC